jgi:hypothetical protein
MSLWQQLHGERYITQLSAKLHRVVEGQSYISTRKLVDTDDEQKLLESMIEDSKPLAPTRHSKGELHWLLFTPFRYLPLKGGGRFHQQHEQSIFYASEELETAMAEVAYRRFLFLLDTKAELKNQHVPHTSFTVEVKTNKAAYLDDAPFNEHRTKISNPESYKYSQALGTEMRENEIEAFRFYSARHPQGKNVGLFSVEAFKEIKPANDKHWDMYVSEKIITFSHSRMKANEPTTHGFTQEGFMVRGSFPVCR